MDTQLIAGKRLAKWLKLTAIAASIALLWICTPAHAGNCGHFFQQQYAAVHYAAPVFAAPVYYQAGRDIEAEALAEKVAKLVAAKLQANSHASAVNARAAAVRTSLVAEHCGKCHSGASAKAGLIYDGSALACFQVTKALRAIADESMPKDHKISPEIKGQIMQELLDLETAPDGVER